MLSESIEVYKWVESVIKDLLKEYERKETKFAGDIGAIKALKELLIRLNAEWKDNFMVVVMIYGSEKFIKAHQDVRNSYYNHSYDRCVRDALCSECGKVIGEQNKYPDFAEEFFFGNEKDNYTHCPFCGHKFKR